MATEYPWVLANNRIPTLFDKIASAGRPERFSQDFLEKIGLTSSNDRGFIPLLRKLGFISEGGQPNSYYDLLRDPNQRPYVMADRIRDLYSDLFSVNQNIHKAPDVEVKGALSRVTGKDETSVDRYFRTFKSLVSQANFEGVNETVAKPRHQEEAIESGESALRDVASRSPSDKRMPSFHYNIQIVLPATTEVAVYSAIFKSLKESLGL
jgi:hypothetical protein